MITMLSKHSKPTTATAQSRGPMGSRPIPQARTPQGNPLDDKKTQLLTGGVTEGDHFKIGGTSPGLRVGR